MGMDDAGECGGGIGCGGVYEGNPVETFGLMYGLLCNVPPPSGFGDVPSGLRRLTS